MKKRINSKIKLKLRVKKLKFVFNKKRFTVIVIEEKNVKSLNTTIVYVYHSVEY